VTLVYAVLADLAGYAPAGTTLPDAPEATRLLTSASSVIRRATMTAVYEADTSGYPTDTAIRDAFRRATCAQALWWMLTGDEQGLVSLYETVSIGSVNLSRRGSGKSAGTGVSGQQLAPQAVTELRGAVLPGSVVQIYPWERPWL
jgi:hypothetical protein